MVSDCKIISPKITIGEVLELITSDLNRGLISSEPGIKRSKDSRANFHIMMEI